MAAEAPAVQSPSRGFARERFERADRFLSGALNSKRPYRMQPFMPGSQRRFFTRWHLPLTSCGHPQPPLIATTFSLTLFEPDNSPPASATLPAPEKYTTPPAYCHKGHRDILSRLPEPMPRILLIRFCNVCRRAVKWTRVSVSHTGKPRYGYFPIYSEVTETDIHGPGRHRFKSGLTAPHPDQYA